MVKRKGRLNFQDAKIWHCIDQHWQVLTDAGNGIIGPDGNPVVLDSIVPNAPKEQFVAVIDSGYGSNIYICLIELYL